ncbi:unnamed protein product [Mytilus coruscus]|uniref:TRIM2_3 n=1 Tax=Mytilus coruscus TaxID=42192 RepID=A0A6J8AVI3_MYTCO|nr:unnamed protein product [Mytilus coruscus]
MSRHETTFRYSKPSKVIRLSSAFRKIDLKNLKKNLDKAIRYLKKRISTNSTKKTEAVEEIRHMRKSIDDFLNKLEQKILDDLESKHSKLKSEMIILVQQMEQRAVQINQLQSDFTKMTQYATELQMYVGLKEIEKATSQVTKYVEDLKRGGQFDENNLEVTISSDLQSILQHVKSFGYINIHTTPLTLHVKAGRKDQAQHLLKSNTDIEEIKPSLLRTLTIPNDMNSLNIRACVALPECKVIILDYIQYQLLLFSEDGIFIRKVISFTAGPWDACYVMKNTVAVTLGDANQTAIVDIEKGTIIQTIKLSHYCNGVASDGKTLIISSDHDQSTTVNLNDMSHTILEGVRASSVSFFQGNIYVSIFKGNEVSCYKSTGNLLWTFIHDDLYFPRGLALDKNGFVYIACKEENCIVVVSPDGKTCKTILSEDDGIVDPYAIDINRETGTMIVSSDDSLCETIYVYKI